MLNFLVACASLIGCALALALGHNFEDVTPYFLPFAGGMFLYLSLGCLLPEIMHFDEDGPYAGDSERNAVNDRVHSHAR